MDLPLSACGCKKFTIDSLGDHVSTCTTHSGTKKSHDREVDQIHNPQSINVTGGSEPGSTMRGHRFRELPREFGGSGVFDDGPPHLP